MSSNCQQKMALMKPKFTNNNNETAATECKTGPCVFVGRFLAWVCQHMFGQRVHTTGCFFHFHGVSESVENKINLTKHQ